MKRILQVFVALAIALSAAAQNSVETNHKAIDGSQSALGDSSTLLHAFKRGQLHGHFRYFLMATDNDKNLADYFANAIGGGIKFETAPYKGFQFGVAGYFIFNIGSSDLSRPESETNQLNRYELGLFDVEDPLNKSDMDRLEELYLKYSWRQSHLTFGRQLVNTPFINPQDGRMRPTEVGGLYGEINELRDTKIELGYFYEVSPRSTVKWYKTAESIGLYPQGVGLDGLMSDYRGNLKSKGIIMLGITQKISPRFSVTAHNLLVDNISNSILLQADFRYPLENESKVTAGIQAIRQNAINDGGNTDPSETYFSKGGKSQTFGAMVGWMNKRWQTSLNYNRITKAGRYLMPREWGRDPFFTFLPRERNEGLGDVNAYVVKLEYSVRKPGLKLQLGIGFFDLPEVNNFILNKYGMPSYSQININTGYVFRKALEGLEAQLLYVYKSKAGSSFGDDKYVINKVNMSSLSFIINYHF